MLNVTDVGSGTAVLWIHGFPLSSAIFEDQLPIRGARHIIPDLPGFGASRPAAGDLTMDSYARIAIDVLDHRGIDQAIFAGVSMGGYACFAAIRLAPERVGGLILIDTKETADSEEARSGRHQAIEKVRAEGVGPLVESMLPKMLTSAAPAEMHERLRGIMMTSSPEGVTAALRAMAVRPDSSSLLPTITVPTLVVVGEHDTITPPSDAERMAAAIPGARLVRLAGAAHLSNMETAEEFNKAVEVFLHGGRKG